MPVPVIQALLILLDRDLKRLGVEAQLKAVPGDIVRVEQRIAAEKAAIEAARMELRDLEAKKKVMETEIGSTEDKLGRYKTQQLLVRKNDEYQALSHEIETTQTQDPRTVTVDEVVQTIPGGTQTFELKTDGWGWLFGGGLEVWVSPSFAIYGEFDYGALKGSDVSGGEARIDDRLTSALLGLRVHIGK